MLAAIIIELNTGAPLKSAPILKLVHFLTLKTHEFQYGYAGIACG
jgi:hypothetical protein